MLHRVSSRPRLVSDADASFRASVEISELDREGDWDFDEGSFAPRLPAGNPNASPTEPETRPRASFDPGKRKRAEGRAAPASIRGGLASDPARSVGAASASARLDGLPDEAAAAVAAFLSPSQIRSLSLSNKALRRALTTSPAAAEGLWMALLRSEFPAVFRRPADGGRAKALSAADVRFVDSFRMPLFGVGECDRDEGGAAGEVNLSLLTGLIPKRYPRGIDAETLGTERHPFRVYAAFLQDADVHADSSKNSASPAETSGGRGSFVSVVQFAGTIGTGDRCIRSDLPFPPLRSADFQDASGGSSSSGAYRKLSSALSGGRKRSVRRESGGRGRSGGDATDPPPLAGLPSAPTSGAFRSAAPFAFFAPPVAPTRPLLSPPRPPAPSSPRPGSPLRRFLSALSKSDSENADSSRRSSDAFPPDDSDEERTDGGYGVFLFGMRCRERLGKLTGPRKKTKDPRPFVTPVAVAPEEGGGPRKKLTVDLTPRFVAYFEVSVLKNPPRGADPEPPAPEGVRAPAPAGGAAGLAPRVSPPRPLRDRRAVPPAPPTPATGRFALRPPPPRRRDDGPRRRECVAVGLSAPEFGPSLADKMPGWDESSYGWHGDDGGVFHGRGDAIRSLGASFGAGDVVGCGLDYARRRIFFVKNGEFLGYAFDVLKEDVIERGLFPTVGVDTECPLFVNFGEKPFQFDLSGFAREGCRVAED